MSCSLLMLLGTIWTPVMCLPVRLARLLSMARTNRLLACELEVCDTEQGMAGERLIWGSTGGTMSHLYLWDFNL